MSAPEWLKVGARVAVFTYGRGSTNTVEWGEVKSIGKRDVVLTDGKRFNVKTLRPLGRRDDAWAPLVELCAPDDPKVRVADRAAHLRQSRARVNIALDDWVRTGDDGHARTAIITLKRALLRREMDGGA